MVTGVTVYPARDKRNGEMGEGRRSQGMWRLPRSTNVVALVQARIRARAARSG